jgi:uncharacterized protein
MSKKVFINLPVKDLQKSMTFFDGLGYEFNAQFTDDNAACMVVSEHIFVMLLTENFFSQFTKKEICNAKTHTEVLISLEAESKQKVDEIVAKAKSLGASIYSEPNDHGWIYQHSFADLDGHQWEFAFMDLSHFQS